ncbi:MAG: DUF3179 domain-containing protein [Gemmatimonadetes bacterium]|nr:DUF3179 domain-containing protein [Gemmatimonadota bacterium]
MKGRTIREHGRLGRIALGSAMIALLAACQDTPPTGVGGAPLCDLDSDLLISSLAPNAIPALNEPPMVAPDDPTVDYLRESDRVLGVVVEGEARAYPHNIFWWHEIVNDRIGDTWISLTFCPLTGSGLGFDPELEGFGRLDLGVSGLLFANNLVMYDRDSEAVYGPQLSVEGSCETFQDRSLELRAVQEMSWARWKALHPDTRVVSGDLQRGRNYQLYPYGSYDDLTSNELLFPMSVDRTRHIKERVLAIRVGKNGKGYPFLELAELGSVVALNETVGGVPTAVFFEEGDGMAALAFDARVDGQTLTFAADPDAGVWIDDETGSTWTFGGDAIDGPLAGSRLTPRADAYTLFWFAWRHFQPSAGVFEAG